VLCQQLYSAPSGKAEVEPLVFLKLFCYQAGFGRLKFRFSKTKPEENRIEGDCWSTSLGVLIFCLADTHLANCWKPVKVRTSRQFILRFAVLFFIYAVCPEI